MSDLPTLRPIRAYPMGSFVEPDIKRGIPKGIYWLGALAVSLAMWAGIAWCVYRLLMGEPL